VSFGAAETVAVGRGPSRVFAVDVDLDGWVDLVTVNELSSNLSVVMNDGGVFAGAAAVPLGSGVTDAAAGDLNGDGLVDFAASVSSGLALAVNGGGGSFSAASVGSALAIGRVGIVDVAGGRQADVVAAALQSGTVLVFENVTPPAGTVVCPGDVSSDRRVGLDDLLVVLSAFGCGGGCGGADATGDGAVSLDDLMLVLSRFGAACGTE
jgi:hypothetical protein